MCTFLILVAEAAKEKAAETKTKVAQSNFMAEAKEKASIAAQKTKAAAHKASEQTKVVAAKAKEQTKAVTQKAKENFAEFKANRKGGKNRDYQYSLGSRGFYQRTPI